MFSTELPRRDEGTNCSIEKVTIGYILYILQEVAISFCQRLLFHLDFTNCRNRARRGRLGEVIFLDAGPLFIPALELNRAPCEN